MPRLDESAAVLSASLWHRDCDPFLGIIVSRPGANDGTKYQTIERMIDEAHAEERERVLGEQDCTDDCDENGCSCEPDVLDSGAQEFFVWELDLTPDQLRELGREGYLYV